MYRLLYEAWGPQNWWPARSRFEVIVGTFLTQNTAWRNVERAISNLQRARAMTVAAIRRMPTPDLEQLIRPAGYFRQKAHRLKLFVAWLDANHGGSLGRMFAQRTDRLRGELLALHGVGPETADSILLYGGGHESFVVDAYTRRILERHGIVDSAARYDEIRVLCERALHDVPVPACAQPRPAHAPSRASQNKRSPRAQVFSEMHALIVGVAKEYCWKSIAKCEACPLRALLPQGRTSAGNVAQ